MRVLVVDDDPITLELIGDLLRDENYDVITAHDGAEALEVMHHEDCRLVISDWEMPQMDGLELCRQLRAMSIDRYVYFLLLTGRDSSDDLVRGMEAGADDFIPKPFNPAELIVRLRAGERILGMETRDLTIFAMARLAESRDPETGAHLDRVRSYARTLTRHLVHHPDFRDDIDDQFCQLIYLTSPLHDIGKVAIPDCVLLKPGRLSDEEFEIMKQHTSLGAQTLQDALEEHPEAMFLQIARDIAISHHERFDGSGYPNGLTGDDIPLAGRIVAVADVFDALTSKRVYKEAFADHVSRSIVVDGAGAHFDPRIVDVFCGLKDEFDAINQHLRDGTAIAA